MLNCYHEEVQRTTADLVDNRQRQWFQNNLKNQAVQKVFWLATLSEAGD